MSFSETQLEAIEILVGLCVSLKEAPPINQLVKDYYELEGRHLDTTGFKSISDMLQASDRFHLIQRGGTLFVTSKVNYESLHIIQMVSRQANDYRSKGSKNQRNANSNQSKKQSNKLRPLHRVVPQSVPFTPKIVPKNGPLPSQLTKVIKPEVPVPGYQMPMTNPFHSSYFETPVIPEPFAKVDKNNSSGLKSPVMLKPSVQNRLAVIKRSVSNESEKTQDPEVPPESAVKEVPLEWLATENMSVIARLEQYCKLKNLPPPNYTYFKVREGKQFKFQCRVTIEDSTYSTYPEDFETKEKARIVCAARAVESIKLQQDMTQYPLFDGDKQELICKIFDIVSSHRTGVFLTEIPNLFRSTFNMSIQSHYFRVMSEEYPQLFKIEQQPGTLKEIVYPEEGASLPRHPSQSSFTEDDPNTLPPRIKLPWEQATWNILVTFFETTSSVWCNLLGADHYDARVDLYDEIELAGITQHPDHFIVDEYYIAVVHQCPHRIRTTKVDADQNKILCRFIDTGELEWLENDQIYICDKKFLELPAQAVPLSLEGLTLFNKVKNIDYCLTELNDKVLIAKIHTNEETYRKNKNLIKVTLYDTSTEEDINVNEQLLKKISETILKPSKLSEKFNCVNITNVSDSGIITGTLKDGGYMNLVRDEIKRIARDGDKMKECQGVTGAENESDLYLVFDNTIKHFVRAKPVKIDVNNLDILIVNLIDYGTEMRVNKKNLFHLRSLSRALEAIPPQALRMRLHGVTNIDDQYIVSLLRGFLKPDTTALVKVNEFSVDTKEPSVSIFFRSPKGGLQSLNDAITSQSCLSQHSSSDLETNVSPSDFVSNQFSISKVSSSQLNDLPPQLPKICIPDIKHDFGVKVILSQSPQMFYVQPSASQKQFQQLVAKMQKYYETMNDLLDLARLKEGAIYATYRMETKEWCRAKLLTCYSEHHIKVHFSDYACIDVVPLKHLKELPNDFRNLPEQAIQAKLYGVKPKSTAGYSSAAAHRFIELTKNKKFDAVVMGIDMIPETYERVITLDLQMKSSDGKSEVRIREILMREQLAVEGY